MNKSIVYLIPSLLAEDGLNSIPSYVAEAVKECQLFFVEEERTARRYLKQIWREMVIDDYRWINIHKAEIGATTILKKAIQDGLNVGIISEAGCPGIADPGQILVDAAHRYGGVVKPLVGPSSILLALMGSGLNGQQFQFCGYLPIDSTQRVKMIRQLEEESARKNCTQIFIETPYRNNQLFETLTRTCKPKTRLSIAANLTGANESIITKTIGDWKKTEANYHKQPVIFSLLGES